MGTGGPFPGGKAQLGRDTGHSPPSSAKVLNEVGAIPPLPLHLHRCVVGLLYLFLLHIVTITRGRLIEMNRKFTILRQRSYLLYLIVEKVNPSSKNVSLTELNCLNERASHILLYVLLFTQQEMLSGLLY
jgi:hypothetical protein